MTSDEIRQQYLEFFRNRGHQIVPSAPIVVKNDPTLLFSNAGMNQFKDYFLGNKAIEFKRVADTQKCLRVSGKHNDLEEVGTDGYHHTMFEMLGNWSFGDYFKEEAIAWSWELLTEVYGIAKDRLYVTVFGGDITDNLPRDEEALAAWKKWLEPDRILTGSKKDNFWEMGDTGPCGPCTEIHIDCRSDEERRLIPGSSLINGNDPQVIEIWNNVFIQFNRLQDGSLIPLPARHVDTGMGLERLVRVIQQKQSNYDTDLFSPVIRETERLSNKKYTGGDFGTDIAFRVIADHIRAICFTLADGQLPSNTGAGYVVRRILRRAVRYYFSFFGIRKPLLYELVPVLAHQFNGVFPELINQADFIKKVVFEEEEAFLRTIQSGMSLFNAFLQDEESNVPGNRSGIGDRPGQIRISGRKKSVNLESAEPKNIPGEFAFELYDTFGFPLDLTKLLAREKGWIVDEEGFNRCMLEQKTRSRKATAQDAGDWVVFSEGDTVFTGYQDLRSIATLRKYRKIINKGKEEYQLVLDNTPFYAESGGQVGDRGSLDFSGEIIAVTDTRKENELIVHVTKNLPKDLSARILATVDPLNRQSAALNHTATHLLHAALRQVLGRQVFQKGSLVRPEYLRFDFSQFTKMTEKELEETEKLVNQKIRENIPVMTQEMNKEDAMNTGAMAIFGEKYGNMVRVVTIDPAYSVELCGGTHVQSTGEIGYFKIIAEGAVAAGVRRVEALTGSYAENDVTRQSRILHQMLQQLKMPADPVKAIDQLFLERGQLQKKVELFEMQQLEQLKSGLLQRVSLISGIGFAGELVRNIDHPDILKKLCFSLKSSLGRSLIILAADIGGKAQIALMIEESLAAERNWDASAIIRSVISPLIRGAGGGQRTFATAGGSDTSHFQMVFDQVRAMI